MNTLLLHPTDVLFFRDGRPMGGSLAGHGAAWPLPTVLNGALHAALWRADLDGVHTHRRGRSSDRRDDAARDRKFGSLVTAGPFPVLIENDHGQQTAPQWFFPRPSDAQDSETTAVTVQPAKLTGSSSLPSFLQYAVANTRPPTKDKPAAWWSKAAWDAYLQESSAQAQLRPTDFKDDTDLSDTEHTIGIGISADTGTQNGEQFYFAHYLRLREGWRLGAFAEALDKDFKNQDGNNDLIEALFPNNGTETPVIIGGQQRLCTVARHSNVESALPLPRGVEIAGTLVKWILLTPAIWPEIGEHKGGWLPSWIRHSDGQVMLKAGDTFRHEKEGREPWRKRVAALPEIPARLVAALVPKSIPVTGYAIGEPEAKSEIRASGAKPTHLAVPAGAVYYFEAESEPAARALANALNWHGSDDSALPTPHSPLIKNRRSTLFGEKGFGLGVCGTWAPRPGSAS